VTENHQCLAAAAVTDEDVKVLVVLDTGAATSLVGKGFIRKRENKGLGPIKIQEIPSKFKILGVSSENPIKCKGLTEFGLKFEGGAEETLRFKALVVPDWEGDVIISWNALDMLGINFTRDRNSGRTTHVNLEKVRVTVPILNNTIGS